MAKAQRPGTEGLWAWSATLSCCLATPAACTWGLRSREGGLSATGSRAWVGGMVLASSVQATHGHFWVIVLTARHTGNIIRLCFQNKGPFDVAALKPDIKHW